MANQDRTILKEYFNTGDRPTESNLVDLIDSNLNILEDKALQADVDAGTNDNKFVTPLGAVRAISTFVKDASTTIKGIAEIATLAEVETGTDSDRFVTPEGAKRAAEKHALVKKVNGVLPDVAGNIQIDVVTGNAGTATKLATPKNINGVAFDGSADITLPDPVITTISGNSGTATKLAAPKNINGVAFDGSMDITIPVVSVQSAFLVATQANTTVTPAVLTGHTFTIPAGKSAVITGNLIFTAAAVTTGGAYGIRVAQGAGANANAIGAWSVSVTLTSAAAATNLVDGDVFNVAAGTNALGEVLGTATGAGNNAATLNAVIKNTATNAVTTVTIEFRSEVATSAVTAQIGSGTVVVIS